MGNITFARTTKKQAQGIAKGNLMKIVCAFDIETWEDIRARATRAGTSFAEQVRLLVELGLESHL